MSDTLKPIRQEQLIALADRLKERRKLKYIASCKCGDCQIVDHDDLWLAGEFIALAAKHPDMVAMMLAEDSTPPTPPEAK